LVKLPNATSLAIIVESATPLCFLDIHLIGVQPKKITEPFVDFFNTVSLSEVAVRAGRETTRHIFQQLNISIKSTLVTIN